MKQSKILQDFDIESTYGVSDESSKYHEKKYFDGYWNRPMVEIKIVCTPEYAKKLEKYMQGME